MGSLTFVQDGAPPNIANPVKRLFSMHFRNYRIITRHFLTNWPPRSPDINPCDFWLWGYVKHVVFSSGGLGMKIVVARSQRGPTRIHNAIIYWVSNKRGPKFNF
ncbi:hypothetical protein AVEN_144438-1 [Araneus ventricosus]|uniref:Uncharacterized protein n=1 Tax=Araneus ventricosus TaxID=182803 RepID=A0A4Y2E0H0_ARAVE|nr:hypothetical protein AVEN_144438-1 [Araneus ventricosus]